MCVRPITCHIFFYVKKKIVGKEVRVKKERTCMYSNNTSVYVSTCTEKCWGERKNVQNIKKA